MEDRYCLQMVRCGDGCGNNGGSSVEKVYSTDEMLCGKWIDGKPIYRKVIVGKLAKDSGNAVVFANVSDLKIDKVIDLYGNFTDEVSNGQSTLQTSYNRTNGLFAAVNMFYGNETGNIFYHYFNNSGYYAGATANVIIEYTKKNTYLQISN